MSGKLDDGSDLPVNDPSSVGSTNAAETSNESMPPPEVLITPYHGSPTYVQDQVSGPHLEGPSMPVMASEPVEKLSVPSAAPPAVRTGPGEAPKPSRKPLFGGLAACLACGCLGIPVFLLVSLVVLSILDPLNLHLWGRLNGRYDAAAEVMPADTTFYVGINIGNALLTRVDKVFAPMLASDQAEQSGLPGNLHADLLIPQHQQTTFIDDFLQQVLSETGVKLPEDLTPWIGQYAGIGIIDFKGSDYGAYVPASYLIALEARNLVRADAFLETLEGNLSSLQGLKFDKEIYNGLTIYVSQSTHGVPALAFGRFGRMVLIASDVNLLKDSMGRQAAQSLPQQADYSRLVVERPRTWSMSMLYNQVAYADIIQSIMESGVGASSMLNSLYAEPTWTTMLVDATVIRNGLRVDAYTTMTTPQQSLEQPQKIVQLLPEDTVAYFAMPRFDTLLQSTITLALTDSEDASTFYDAFEEYFGFSLTDDFLSHLSGQGVIYVVPSKNGMLPTQSDLDLAVCLLAETDNNLDLQKITFGLSNLTEVSGNNIQRQQLGELTFYQVTQSWSSDPMLAYGQSNGYFALGTDVNVLQATLSTSKPLVNSASYQGVVSFLPAGMQPFGYVDFDSMFANLREGMDSSQIQSFDDGIGILDHFSKIIMAARMVQPDVSHSTVVVLMTGR